VDVIKRGDGSYFVGNMGEGGFPYEAYGPLSVVDADTYHGFATEPGIDNDMLVLFRERRPDASLWATYNGDEYALRSHTWRVQTLKPSAWDREWVDA